MENNKYRITDDIEELIDILPADIQRKLEEIDRHDELLEVILDLGRVPTARYTDSEVVLSEREVTDLEIEAIVARVGEFDADNRAGIERTLHRISAIRNRRGDIVGLTCRIGRAVYGTVDIVQDLVESGKNLLFLGPPGVGKTTILREAARVLAEKKRVIIVDTSNEIGGDGDVPHPAIGRARRMQVREPIHQHEVLIAAGENHNPEVIVIDEIGRELEAVAARTIAERGVQLIGTAHGNTLENLLLNPTLSDLVGGIEAVTLSDEEARRRGTQKTVLERRAPPTFDVLIEIQTRHQLAVHPDVAEAVDAMVRGRKLPIETRTREEDGTINKEREQYSDLDNGRTAGVSSRRGPGPAEPFTPNGGGRHHETLRVFAYGVARNRLKQAAKRLNVPVKIVDDFDETQVLVTLKSYYRRRPKLIADMEQRGIPMFVLRSNTITQMENFLADVFELEQTQTGTYDQALNEARDAIQQIERGRDRIDLKPQNANIRRLQHELARDHNLVSRSYGKEPRRHVRIFREAL